jgi:hypothetical protein
VTFFLVELHVYNPSNFLVSSWLATETYSFSCYLWKTGNCLHCTSVVAGSGRNCILKYSYDTATEALPRTVGDTWIHTGIAAYLQFISRS